mmetsp:Transcript_41765/g.67163  ORF Transcript_41765/g.67163 Transcript_41765/m.67163 type:complete len:85 (+) Transcript_41765:1821-2075(+)
MFTLSFSKACYFSIFMWICAALFVLHSSLSYAFCVSSLFRIYLVRVRRFCIKNMFCFLYYNHKLSFRFFCVCYCCISFHFKALT